MLWTDGCGREFKGKDIYVFNARHETFSTTTGLTATVAHELVHSIHTGMFNDDRFGSPLSRSLYFEGAAVFVVQQLFPEIGDGAIGIRKEQLVTVYQSQAVVAKDLLAIWNAPYTSAVSKKYFSGGVRISSTI